MRKIDFCDPCKVLDYYRRREIGCFSCLHSKRERVDFIMKSFCTIKTVEPDLNYPDETMNSCKFYVRRK
jgi:hypothetical protein